jgi:hypothetical protein
MACLFTFVRVANVNDLYLANGFIDPPCDRKTANDGHLHRSSGFGARFRTVTPEMCEFREITNESK